MLDQLPKSFNFTFLDFYFLFFGSGDGNSSYRMDSELSKAINIFETLRPVSGTEQALKKQELMTSKLL